MASQPGSPTEVAKQRRWVGKRRLTTFDVNERTHASPRRACPPKRRVGEETRREGGSNSVVESQPSKLLVAGSIPVSRSRLRIADCGFHCGIWQSAFRNPQWIGPM